MKKIQAHNHNYIQHPNALFSDMLQCTICGFAISKSIFFNSKVNQTLIDKKIELEKSGIIIN